MNEALADLKEQYQDAVAKHLWYSESPFSFFKGKANKQLADKYKREAQSLFDEYCRVKREGA